MKLCSEKFFNEKLLAGVRSLGVGIALAGALAVFFGQSLAAAFVALTIGLVVLILASYSQSTGGKDV